MIEVEAQHVLEHLETPILAVAEVFDCEVIFEVHFTQNNKYKFKP